MEQIPKSGFYYANKFARITLQAYEEVMGKNGLNAILNLAGLSNLIDNFPPDNLEREFDFADFTAIHVGLEEMYGPRAVVDWLCEQGGLLLMMRSRILALWRVLATWLLRFCRLQAKIRIGLPASAKIFSQVTDQLSTVDETDDAFIWTIHRCPICWTRKNADKPVCYISTGLLQAMLTWVSGGLEFRINESKCCAVGDSVCEFVIQKDSIP